MRTFGLARPNRLIAPYFAPVLCILWLAACTSNAILETNKVSDYTKQPKRLFVFETTSPQLVESSTDFQSTMTKLLGNCGVAMDYASQMFEPSVAFGDRSEAANRTKARITQFRPDAILAVTFTRIVAQGSKTVSVDYFFRTYRASEPEACLEGDRKGILRRGGPGNQDCWPPDGGEYSSAVMSAVERLIPFLATFSSACATRSARR